MGDFGRGRAWCHDTLNVVNGRSWERYLAIRFQCMGYKNKYGY